ncbi:MAG: hypothetical protein Tsb0034_11590 [Ekhidna sp.]
MVFLSLAGIAQKNGSNRINFNFRVENENIGTMEATVKFELEEPFSKLQMDPYGIPSEIKKGWAEFVQIESIVDKEGEPIDAVWNSSMLRWDLESDQQQLTLEYKVNLNHDKYDWNSAGGKDARPGILDKNVIFWISKALLIFPSGIDSDTPVSISFDLPASWNVSTPWKLCESGDSYATNLSSARNNLIVIGHHIERALLLDSMQLKIAIVPGLKNYEHLLTESMQKILPVFKNVFGELPTTNYLICASTNFFEDGEAFESSFHQMFNPDGLEYRQIVWTNVFAHEMFHMWNGTNFLVGKNVNDTYWFSEGFTEYYANLALVRTGIISEADFLKKLAFQFGRYFTSSFLRESRSDFITAGQKKFKNWELIYGGGASLAFMLDVSIRQSTDGTKTLDDFMKLLYQRFGKTNLQYTNEDLIITLNDLTGDDYFPFFEKYVFKSAFAPLIKYCNISGLNVAQYMGEFYLTIKDSERSIFKEIIRSEE